MLSILNLEKNVWANYDEDDIILTAFSDPNLNVVSKEAIYGTIIKSY